jgi:putative addiction module CopG family antidote
MKISLPPELGRLVQQKVAAGTYSSEEEVLQAAMRALDAEEETLKAISEGYSDFQSGRSRSLDEADADFRIRHELPQQP